MIFQRILNHPQCITQYGSYPVLRSSYIKDYGTGTDDITTPILDPVIASSLLRLLCQLHDWPNKRVCKKFQQFRKTLK